MGARLTANLLVTTSVLQQLCFMEMAFPAFCQSYPWMLILHVLYTEAPNTSQVMKLKRSLLYNYMNVKALVFYSNRGERAREEDDDDSLLILN